MAEESKKTQSRKAEKRSVNEESCQSQNPGKKKDCAEGRARLKKKKKRLKTIDKRSWSRWERDLSGKVPEARPRLGRQKGLKDLSRLKNEGVCLRRRSSRVL